MNRSNHIPGPDVTVRGLRIPSLLSTLIAQGRWRHPGDDTMSRLIPWFEDPLDFLTSLERIERESVALDRIADHEPAQLFREVRGTTRDTPVELPWLDVEQAVLIAVCRFAGDDVALALDYRTDAVDPRVVGTDIWTDPQLYEWRTVAPTFSAFAAALNLAA
ncbi:hypothetical protein [Kitasatospora sp. NPDC088346]|uniref:hypothetical protein n=1 Tax=Kitasatospora sp. NPDC088346 TaxID=3364073 RepID=UPI0037FA4E44